MNLLLAADTPDDGGGSSSVTVAIIGGVVTIVCLLIAWLQGRGKPGLPKGDTEPKLVAVGPALEALSQLVADYADQLEATKALLQVTQASLTETRDELSETKTQLGGAQARITTLETHEGAWRDRAFVLEQWGTWAAGPTPRTPPPWTPPTTGGTS